MKRRIGIMGGTFNPIHNGHLILGERAFEQYQLDTVIYLPNGNPPHKELARDGITNAQRLELVKLAIADNPHFSLDPEEMLRKEYSYTKDTLKRIKDHFPQDELFFIIGGDSLLSFDQWVEPRTICSYCTLLAAVRNEMAKDTMKTQIHYLEQRYDARIGILKTPNLEISSSKLREMIRCGQSIRYFVPDSVFTYIREHGLYQTAE